MGRPCAIAVMASACGERVFAASKTGKRMSWKEQFWLPKSVHTNLGAPHPKAHFGGHRMPSDAMIEIIDVLLSHIWTVSSNPMHCI